MTKTRDTRPWDNGEYLLSENHNSVTNPKSFVLRACPPEDQAEVIHAISPISVKLGQIEG